MRVAFLLAAGAMAATTAAAQLPRAEICRKDADERVIEIVSPGVVGAACDVRYIRDGGAKITVPYNANVDANFCRARAAELAAGLTAEGFLCATTSSEELEAALAGGPSEPAAADTSEPLNVQLERMARKTPSESATSVAEAAPPAEPAGLPEYAAPEPPAATAEADRAEVESVASVEQREREAAGVEDASLSAPISLAGDARPSAFRAPKPARASGAGRLVGAQPSIEDIIAVSETPAVDPQKTAAASLAGIPARAPEEIIRGVIAANTAAWNEGNLDAYMSGYANTADLMMIKDATVTTGWTEVKKRSEEEIAAAGAMGRLSVSALNVKLTSPDVATVVGRYSLLRGTSTDEGVMTLVMKQIDGRWRIVQDTRIADVRPSE